MIPKSTLLFNDGRIADVDRATSPVIIVSIDTERHLFAQDDRDRRFYVEVTGHRLFEEDLTWVQ